MNEAAPSPEARTLAWAQYNMAMAEWYLARCDEHDDGVNLLLAGVYSELAIMIQGDL